MALGILATGAGKVSGEAAKSSAPNMDDLKPKTEMVKDSVDMKEDTKPLAGVSEDLAKNLKSMEAENEKLKQELSDAEEKLSKIDSVFIGEVNRLDELYPKMSKLLKPIKVLPTEIHEFVVKLLDQNKHRMEDPNFLAKGREDLQDNVLDAGNPPGDALIAFAIALNKETGLDQLVKEMTSAEWRVYLAQYKFDKSTKSLADTKSVTSVGSPDVVSSK